MILPGIKFCGLIRARFRTRLQHYCYICATEPEKFRTFISAGAKAIRLSICFDIFYSGKAILHPLPEKFCGKPSLTPNAVRMFTSADNLG